MSKKKTHEKFVEEVFNLVGNEYEVLEKYINAKTKILFKHIKCNNPFLMTPDHFLRGQRCPICVGKNKRKTTEEFKYEVFNLIRSEYEVLGEYVNDKTKILFIHRMCGNKFKMRPNSFLRGSRCPKCQKIIASLKNRHTFEEVKQFIEFVNDYKLLSDNYITEKIKLKIQCDKGHIFNMDFEHFKRGERCPVCALDSRSFKQRKDILIIEKEVEQYGFTIIRWIDDYKNRNSRFILKCKKGHVKEYSVASFLQYHSCSSCKESKGESYIDSVLNKYNNIIVLPEYKFKDCKNKRYLPFDRAIFDDSDKLLFLIEYDGIQHFEPVDNFGGEKNLKKVQLHDSIKTNYCIANNIKLVRIPYWEFDNIPQILSEELSNILGGDYQREVIM